MFYIIVTIIMIAGIILSEFMKHLISPIYIIAGVSGLVLLPTLYNAAVAYVEFKRSED